MRTRVVFLIRASCDHVPPGCVEHVVTWVPVPVLTKTVLHFTPDLTPPVMKREIGTLDCIICNVHTPFSTLCKRHMSYMGSEQGLCLGVPRKIEVTITIYWRLYWGSLFMQAPKRSSATVSPKRLAFGASEVSIRTPAFCTPTAEVTCPKKLNQLTMENKPVTVRKTTIQCRSSIQIAERRPSTGLPQVWLSSAVATSPKHSQPLSATIIPPPPNTKYSQNMRIYHLMGVFNIRGVGGFQC